MASAHLSGWHSSSCGYCKHSTNPQIRNGMISSSKKRSFGAHLSNVPAQVYDDLIQRNWRRSGDYYYRPDNANLCCPQYAIRLCAEQAVFDKEQRRVISKFRRHLLPRNIPADAKMAVVTPEDPILHRFQEQIYTALQNLYPDLNRKLGISKDAVKVIPSKRKGVSYECPIVIQLIGLCKKSKIDAPDTPQSMANSIISLIPTQDSTKLQSTSMGHINISLPDRTEQQSRRDSYPKVAPLNQPTHKLVLTLSKAEFRRDEYEIYRKYQIEVHDDDPDDISEHSYTRFLCDSSLQFQLKDTGCAQMEIEVEFDADSEAINFKSTLRDRSPLFALGTCHMRYETCSLTEPTDRKLLAVSVVDILPTGLSSVYFFYDTTYKSLSLGKLSALVEIEMVRRFSSNSFKYYYLGFYIHHCTKMRYKGQYEPSEILCPVTLNWTPLDTRVRNILEQTRFAKISLVDETCLEVAEGESIANGMFKLKNDDKALDELGFKITLQDQTRVIPGTMLFRMFKVNDQYVERVLKEWIHLTGVVRLVGSRSSSSCGYCKHRTRPAPEQALQKSSYGCLMDNLAASVYGELINRNWSRSGSYYYRPENSSLSCCPQYCIRLDVDRYQIDAKQRRDIRRFARKLDGKRLRLVLEEAECKDDAYRLYVQYQTIIHKSKPERMTKNMYSDFLCDSGMRTEWIDSRRCWSIEIPIASEESFLDTLKRLVHDPIVGYGAFHLRYEIVDDVRRELIGISVLDVVPAGISSMYHFHNPYHRSLALGAISALVEIELTKIIHQSRPEFEYYYLGYYVHECSKMNYKAQYAPSEILCPITLRWVDLNARVLDILTNNAFACLSQEGPNTYLVCAHELIRNGDFMAKSENEQQQMLDQLEVQVADVQTTISCLNNIPNSLHQHLIDWLAKTGFRVASQLVVQL